MMGGFGVNRDLEPRLLQFPYSELTKPDFETHTSAQHANVCRSLTCSYCR